MSADELFDCRLCALLGDHEPKSIRERITNESWEMWQLFYMEDMWGEQRNDLRALAVIHHNYPDTEATMQYPYFDAEDKELERKAELDERKASLESDASLAEKLARGKELYLANKAAKANG